MPVPTWLTLLTDFGLKDPFVGVMKGVIATRAPEARVIDLSHGVAPQALGEAAFWLSKCFRRFPADTIHVAVVDPTVGTPRRALVAVAAGHRFVAPDNGLLAPVLDATSRVYAVDVERLGLALDSRTFHGRDVFAPVAALLANGDVRPEQVGPLVEPVAADFGLFAQRAEGLWRGSVISVDRFGNLISNIEARELGDARWTLRVAGQKVSTVGTYAEARSEEPVALIGSFGTLEIAVRNGSAAARLGILRGAPVVVECEPD